MTTSHDPTDSVNTEKEEGRPSTSEKTQQSLQEFLKVYQVPLPLEGNGSVVSIRICENNPHFNAALNTVFSELYSGVEWHFIQDLYQASLLPEDKKQAKAEELVEKYITAAGPYDIALNLNEPFLAKVAKNVKAGGGLDSFRPLFGPELPGDALNILTKNNVTQNGKIQPEHALLLRDALAKDRLMSILPIRTVICHVLDEIKPPTLIEKAKKRFKRVDATIEASELLMRDVQKQLNELLKMSADPSVTPAALQKNFEKIVKENHPALVKAHQVLVKTLGSNDPHVQKINALSASLSAAVHENKKLNEPDSSALAALATPDNTKLIKKHMEPIEKQLEKENKEVAPTSPRSKRMS